MCPCVPNTKPHLFKFMLFIIYCYENAIFELCLDCSSYSHPLHILFHWHNVVYLCAWVRERVSVVLAISETNSHLFQPNQTTVTLRWACLNSKRHHSLCIYALERTTSVRRLVSIEVMMLATTSAPPRKSLSCTQSRKGRSPFSNRGTSSSHTHLISACAYETKASNSCKG